MSTWQETEFGKIPSNWDYLRIENTDLQIGDGNYSSKYPRASELLAEGIPFISSTDLSNGKISANSLRYISTEHHSRLLKGHIKQGDVLIVVRGNGVGQVALVSKEYEDANLNAQMAYLGRSNRIDGAFLYYLLSKYYSDGVTETVVSGSAQPQITVSSLKQLSLIIPPVNEQNAIAAILSSLDDKIDLLHRQNKTLEAMAESLFRQWFVEESQEDWEEYSLSDFASHLKGNVVPAKNPDKIFHHYSLPAFDAGMRPTVEAGSEILSNKFEVKPWSILVSKLNPRFPRIWPISDLPECASICSTEFQVFKPKNENLYGYLYFLLRSDDAKDELVMAASGTSGSHQRVRPEDILSIKTSLPSLNLAEQFSALVTPGIKKVWANNAQIYSLEKLRDTLLPKLMSGEVRVA